MKVIGILDSASPESRGEELTAFHAGLRDAGIDGKDVILEYAWADNQYDRLPGLAAELLRREAAVLVAAGGPVSALAAKAATANTNTPVVFTAVANPVASGLVADLKRPGGNLTGTFGRTSELDPKRLELLHRIKPTGGPIGVLVNPNRPDVEKQSAHLQAAAKKLKRELVVLSACTEREIDSAFKTLAKKKVDALLVTADPFFNSRRAQVAELAARNKIPGMYQWPGFVSAGGLMSYGPSKEEAYYQTGIYVGRILKGAVPADLPVMQPKKLKLHIDLKKAKAFRLKIPSDLRAGAVVVE